MDRAEFARLKVNELLEKRELTAESFRKVMVEAFGGCACNAGHEEPTFTLRARDPLAIEIVQQWASRALDIGVRELKSIDAMQIAGRMLTWQKEHGFKRPD